MGISLGRVTTARGKRLTAEQRRAEIIGAARQAFLESGLSGTSLREIARRAGVTEGLLYHHFNSKEELFATAVEEPLDALTQRLRDETHALATRGDVSKRELLFLANQQFLGAMVERPPSTLKRWPSTAAKTSTERSLRRHPRRLRYRYSEVGRMRRRSTSGLSGKCANSRSPSASER